MQATGLTVSVSALPTEVQDDMSNQVSLRMGIGEIEAMATNSSDEGSLRFVFSGAPELSRLMSHHRTVGFTRVVDVYWRIGTASLLGIVDRDKTRLAELVGELRSVTPAGASLPSQIAAQQAIHIVIHGRGNSINLAQSGTEASAGESGPEKPFWTMSRRIGAVVVGTATVVATVIGVLQWQASS